jgi:DNA-binding winged helix-turn-helix (wHTH) protein
VTSGRFCFDRFTLDVADRQLRRDDESIELNSRYLDALALLVSEQGRLVPKDRFLDEVWRGVPVTDEALTQCVKTLRRQLGDDAAKPRFIETVPKHGYRFIAPVEETASQLAPPSIPAVRWRDSLLLGAAGTIGGGIAGIIGGLFYGFTAASQPLAPGLGAISIMLVLLCVTILVAVIGAAGVSFGIAAGGRARGAHWLVVGGALGGLVVGGVVKLLGLDAFNLLIGHSPGDITGPLEGLLIGGATGMGVWLSHRFATADRVRRSALLAAALGGAAGVLISLLGGRMMGGSLLALEESFGGSRLRLDRIGALFGERGFGPVTQAVTAALEGALFGGCVVAAMVLARRHLTQAHEH